MGEIALSSACFKISGMKLRRSSNFYGNWSNNKFDIRITEIFNERKRIFPIVRISNFVLLLLRSNTFGMWLQNRSRITSCDCGRKLLHAAKSRNVLGNVDRHLPVRGRSGLKRCDAFHRKRWHNNGLCETDLNV